MIVYRRSPALDDSQLNNLFRASWDGFKKRDFAPVLSRSLGYVAAFDDENPIGFVNLAWDGCCHAFLLDTTVHPNYRRRGIGTELVSQAVMLAREHAVSWLHVDFEPRYAEFYRRCGFRRTEAGLMALN
jgi:GNAT superfamily N-acetyltransferase